VPVIRGSPRATGLLRRITTGDLADECREAIRFPYPELVHHVPDAMELLDQAAQIAAEWGGSWLIAETLAAGAHYGRAL
jgi:hypothetical protein